MHVLLKFIKTTGRNAMGDIYDVIDTFVKHFKCLIVFHRVLTWIWGNWPNVPYDARLSPAALTDVPHMFKGLCWISKMESGFEIQSGI